jgi:hypothetical protein
MVQHPTLIYFQKPASESKSTATADAKPAGDAKPADGKKAPEFVDVVSTKKADASAPAQTSSKVI